MSTRRVRTHYDNLKVAQHATNIEIRSAYRRLASRFHPDRNADPNAETWMRLINEAYQVLSDPHTRAKHDQWIALQANTSKALSGVRPAPRNHQAQAMENRQNHNLAIILCLYLIGMTFGFCSMAWLLSD